METAFVGLVKGTAEAVSGFWDTIMIQNNDLTASGEMLLGILGILIVICFAVSFVRKETQ